MALPQKIKVNDITGASSPDLIDNDLNAGIKQPLLDIFSIPDNTNISNALMEVTATGLKNVRFQDATANPATAGYLQRNGTLLNFYDGAANRVLVSRDATETLTNKTLTTPIISTISNTGTVTLFTASDTVVGKATTDTLTNKTLTAPAISDPVLSGTSTGTYTLAGTPTVSSAINLTSGQIAFPATQVPSAGANTLDDYEEGAWTPSVGGTATYLVQTGTYTKVGRVVTVQGSLQINAIGTGSVNAISGLPFTAGGDATGAVYWNGAAASYVTIIARAVSGGTSVQLDSATAAGASLSSSATIMANSTIIKFTITYFV